MWRASILLLSFALISCGSKESDFAERDRKPAGTEARHRVESEALPESGERSAGERIDAGPENGGNRGFASPGKPVLLDFARDDCLPCRIMSPWVEELRKKYAGKAEVVKIDTARPDNAALERYFKIRTIPTQIYLDGRGSLRLRHEGLATPDEMNRVMERLF